MLSGEQLKFLRYYNGKTQQQVADWCNVSRRYIIMVEQNEERLSEKTYNALMSRAEAMAAQARLFQQGGKMGV